MHDDDHDDDVDDRALNFELIAQAEGMLSVRRGIAVGEAALELRAEAAALGRSLSSVARDVVDGQRGSRNGSGGRLRR
jgi:AmiR/NasT family two-component response regulator